uniref:Putative zinc-or iron-chelating protein n=1 Tax=viral metagenome TaxID=1070528 RepID=A0A6M3M4H2_9ZZZZ
MKTDEDLNDALRQRVKYPHGSWVMKEKGKILVQMPGYSFTGNIPEAQTEYIMETGRPWGYWVLSKQGQIALYNPTPCVHLSEEGLCGIYEIRPRACKMYSCRRHPIVP